MTIQRAAVLLLAILALVLVFAIGASRSQHRHRQQLFRIATLGEPVGSDQVLAAIKALVADESAEAGQMLSVIALGQYPNAGFWPEAQNAAIRALAERDERNYAQELATLLQPYQDLELRRTVAKAVVKLECNERCVQSVLHYKERMWRGEPTLEAMLPSGPEAIQESVQRQTEEVERNLDSVVLRSRASTIGVLAAVYGLGSSAPSPFAINLARRIDLKETCPLLIRSVDRAAGFKGSREPDGLQEAIQVLQCR